MGIGGAPILDLSDLWWIAGAVLGLACLILLPGLILAIWLLRSGPSSPLDQPTSKLENDASKLGEDGPADRG